MHEWAHECIAVQIESASEALTRFCRKPRSAKRLHKARKELARLRAALNDVGDLAGADNAFRERIDLLHKRAGKVRDADALVARIDDYRDAAGGQERAQLALVRKALCKRRKRARRKLERLLAQLPGLQA